MVLTNESISLMNITTKQDLMPECNPEMATVMIIRNDRLDTFLSHPYFMIVLLEQGHAVPINYAFSWFLHAIRAPACINTRAREVRVVSTIDLFCPEVSSLPFELLNVFHRQVDQPGYNHASCKNCNVKSRRCDGAFPCKRCVTLCVECLPNDAMARVSLVFSAVSSGRIVHHDLARYTLNAQSEYYGVRAIDGKQQQIHIRERVVKKWGMNENEVFKPEYNELPLPLKSLCNKYAADNAIRIQWMVLGEYISSYNKEWTDNFMGPVEIESYAKSSNCPPLLLETFGCGNYRVAYSLFVESLNTEGEEVFHQDMVYWRSVKTMRKSTIRMKTVIIDRSRIVNVTVINLR